MKLVVKPERRTSDQTKFEYQRYLRNFYFMAYPPRPKTRYEFAYENHLEDSEIMMDGKDGAYTKYLVNFYADYYTELSQTIDKAFDRYGNIEKKTLISRAVDILNKKKESLFKKSVSKNDDEDSNKIELVTVCANKMKSAISSVRNNVENFKKKIQIDGSSASDEYFSFAHVDGLVDVHSDYQFINSLSEEVESMEDLSFNIESKPEEAESMEDLSFNGGSEPEEAESMEDLSFNGGSEPDELESVDHLIFNIGEETDKKIKPNLDFYFSNEDIKSGQRAAKLRHSRFYRVFSLIKDSTFGKKEKKNTEELHNEIEIIDLTNMDGLDKKIAEEGTVKNLTINEEAFEVPENVCQREQNEMCVYEPSVPAVVYQKIIK
ncbi:MAG: hypothetical protein PUB18_03360 [bacterium]|nr:hypothetical protein [bacterium]